MITEFRTDAILLKAPVRVRQWLRGPLMVLGLGAVEISLDAHGTGGWPSGSATAVTTVLLVVAAALLVVGYLAYRDVSAPSVKRFLVVSSVAMSVCGIVLSYGVTGWIFLAWSGWRLVDCQLGALRRVAQAITQGCWRRIRLAAAVIGIACLLLLPLALGLESFVFVTLVMAGRILAPFVFGFALRSLQLHDVRSAPDSSCAQPCESS